MRALSRYPKSTLMDRSAKLTAVRFGRWAERLCRWTLIVSGWRILAHGYRPKRGSGAGEIDLIVRRGNVVAFIEIKARHTVQSGMDAISQDQRLRIMRSAELYIGTHPHLESEDIRFDVMLVRPWRLPMHIREAWRP